MILYIMIEERNENVAFSSLQHLSTYQKGFLSVQAFFLTNIIFEW